MTAAAVTLPIFEVPIAHTSELALRLAQADNELRALTADQVDAIIDADGQPYLLRPAQEQLRQNEQWLHAIIESSADVITVLNRGGVILLQNRTIRRVLGYDPGTVVGKRFFDLVSEQDLAMVYLAFFNVIEGFDDYSTVRFCLRDSQGVNHPVEGAISPLRGFSSASVVLSLRRVTSLPLSSKVLLPRRESSGSDDDAPTVAEERSLGTLIHAMRAPLASVAYRVAELLQDRRLTEAHAALTVIRHNLEQQSRLLEEMIKFATTAKHTLQDAEFIHAGSHHGT